MQLVIAEKPSVARNIAKVLHATNVKDGYLEGKEYLVSWCIGHLIELASADQYRNDWKAWKYETLPMIPENWKYQIKESTKGQFRILKELLHRADVTEIICATDAGREGELIFRLVYNQAECKLPFKRLWISSMEEKAILEGFQQMKDGHEYDNLYYSAVARSEADWLVGINATRLFTVLYHHRLIVGRVQTPTLAMLVEREKSIENFQKEKYYLVHLLMDGLDAVSNRIKEKSAAVQMMEDMKDETAQILSVKKEKKKVQPPKLYDLTTLQREANRLLGFTAQQTLDYTQSLYEKKLVTYPRTDSQYLTDDMEENALLVVGAVNSMFPEMSIKDSEPDIKRLLNSKKVSDHHAIIPTVEITNMDLKALPGGEKEILMLIASKLLCASEQEYIYESKYEVQNLSGAVYEVYAAEDIYTADFQKDDTGKRILEYAKGAKVAELTTDESGKADLDNLPLGEYKVVEKTAPEGFVLNEEEQKISFVYADQDTPVISQSAEFINDRQKVEVSVVKKDAENEKGLSGAEFGLYAKEDIKAGDKVLVKADELLTKAVTGEDGKTVFEQDLPFGIYYIKELAAPDGFVSSDEQIEVTAKYQGQEVKTVKLETVFKNEPTTTEFTKSDITTGVELDGATLTVLDSDGKEVEKWTSVKGKAHVIKRLHVGKTYTLREEFAPYGYLQAEEVKFTVSDTADVQKVEMKDAVPVGRIIINKKGEFVKEVTWKDMLAGGMDAAFGYVTGSLKDVTFEIYAAEDIKAADGESSDYYKKDELVATITTDALGYARSEDLPLGKYYVKEKETADGYVLDGEIREVDLTYRDQNTPVVTYDEDWQNNRQKAKVTVVKKEKNTDRVLEGGVFALYTKNDILNAEGEVILKADTMIEQKATDQDGRIVFTADLPINGSYYVKEVQAPAGFVTTEEIKEFEFAYAGEEVAEVSFEFTYEDEPTTFEITKSDITTGEELPGAKLKVSDSEGNVVDEWTSGSTPHIIKELEVGKKYTLTETIPADGYATAESITFVVENTADIQKVEMQDDTTKILISKVDMTDGSSEVKGAKLYILNENQEVMESWTSGDQPHYVEKLPIGTYTLLEETAPKGYIVANKVTFEIKDTGDIQGAKMEDEQAMGKVILNKTDKDTKKPMKGVEFTLCDSKGKVLETLVTDSAGHAESKNYPIATFKNGQYKKAITYILKETKTLDGYQLDETEHKIQFEYVNDRTPVIEYTLDLTNKKAPEKDTPETSENQGVSTPVSHGSDATSVSNSPKTGDNTNIAIFVLALAVSAGCLGTVVTVKRKRK
ncbi:SpaA isopeptide-forming pilin-related protein [Blautia massiliensis (ex Durand et al. 2017)]|uniref:SpaA isopeptide-forming pilin-related protein n=1 Tax=Blautia massiliensis (ex Durand et al. 2017) TaxID=1737424 RepID=UPI001FC835EE|nr:SpaA isopeptide-forming pilin-related protein [Blautia massiliensis (ex Durand et al. 2017)]